MTVENDVPNDVQPDDVQPDDVKKEAAKVEDDNVGDISVEINVEELVAKIEASDTEDAEKARIRKQLDKLREQQDSELNTTYNFDLDDDL
ncbi:MAG: hypothetical protein IIC12_03155 [Proteobacteria bacterium]|nr:hypothetical protein [Pseudomonadota bacterium]